MAHPLEQRIRRVRFEARRLLVLYAAGWTLAVVVATLLLLGLADYAIRFQDRGIRLMASLCVLLVGGWAIYRFWYLAFRRALGDVELAQRIGRYFPLLADRLAIAVSFLKQSESDVQAGSAALRRAVVHETASEAEGVDFSKALDRRPTRRALGAACGVGLLAAAFAAAAPDSTRIALVRLAKPFGGDAWPRTYTVAFRDPPTRLAAGQTFEVELINDQAHRVPAEVTIFYRFGPDEATTEVEVERMQLLNGAMVAHKDNVTRPFWYRAEGGDDQTMDWIRLEVVEPPRLDALKVTLHPPAYSGLPVEASEKSIHALRGTRVAIEGTATKKLRKVTICQQDGFTLSVPLAADGYGFALAADAAEPLVIDKSGPYWILLEDVEGHVGGADDRWDIRAVADQPPTLTVEHPAANIFVTPQGTVPIRVTAKDDLAIREMGLHFSRSDNADVEDFSVPLYRGPEQAAAQGEGGLLAGGRLGESRTIEHPWSLAELGLKPGTQITCWATAGDYLPQSGKSSVRRLSIISPDELEERLAQRQMLIFAELQRVLKLQQDTRAQTRSLEIQLDRVGKLSKQDVDHAQAAELNQRQVARTLTSPSEGIPAQIADFMDDLANNRVDSPDLERRMTSIDDELGRLGSEHLTPLERDLTTVIKAAQAELGKPDAGAPADEAARSQVKESLATAGENQDQVIESLEGMLDELKQWDNFRRFARDVAQLKNKQEEITEATKEIARQTLGRDVKELEPQQQADLQKLAGEQAELGRRLEKTQQQMSQMRDSLTQSDPLSAAAISDGLHQAREQAISGQMRQSSERIDKNQLAQAVQQQAKIAKDLDELQAILANRREQELARLVKQLREAEQELAGIRARQAGLRKKMRELADKPQTEETKQQLQRLAREQRQLQEEAGRLARRLERLQAEQAGQSASGAVARMGQAGNAGQSGDAAGAGEQAAAAEKDLEEAQQQLAERRQQAEDDLAREQIAKLEDALRGLHERQKGLIGETERLEKLRVADGKFTRAQASTVHDLSRQQKLLETETAQLAEKLSLAEVINMALEGASRQMNRASALLERGQTGTQTQGAQQAARLRFAQLLAAFENKPKNKQGGAEGAGGGGSGGGKGARADGNQVLTQLKLLKILQEDLNSRFRTLTTAGPSEAAAGAQQQLAEIAAEQGRLAELALKLSEPTEENPEDNPENLPDVREGNEPPDGLPLLDDLQLPDVPPRGATPPDQVPPPVEPPPTDEEPKS